MTRISSIMLLILAWSPQSAADLYLWSGTQGNVAITGRDAVINAAGTYKFEALTTPGGSILDDVGLIQINSSVTGTVTVSIERSVGTDMPGAVNVGEIRLDAPGATYVGNLAELRIEGELGVDGPTVVRSLGDAELGSTARDIIVNFNLSGTIEATTITGAITVHNFFLGNASITATTLGDVTVDDDFTGDITIHGDYSGNITAGDGVSDTTSIQIDLDYSGMLDVTANFFGHLNIDGSLTSPGRLAIRGNMSGNADITIGGDANNAESPPILVEGSIAAGTPTATGPFITIGGELTGTIEVWGALANAYGGGHEIVVDSLASLGAIAINSDGDSPNADDWASGATIEVVSTDVYDGTNGNNATDRVWNVGPCRGDLNGDRSVNSTDNATVDGGDSGCNPATLFCVALNSPTQYRALFPGLEGSRIWHGNYNFTDGFTSADSTAFGQLTAGECCIVTRRPGDVDVDFDVDITDLAILLSNFGNTSDPQWGNGDMDGNGSVNLNDLAILLSRFGADYCPSDEPEPLTGGVTITVTGFNTGGASGGGFAGESKHFVFDVLVEIDDTDDDWIGGGVNATTANSASFRIVPNADNPPVPTSSTPDKYATFFSQPYANVDGSNRFNSPFTTGGIAGGYSPTGSGYTYSTSTIDAAWYDTNTASNDGPAAVLRLVVNVENVSGADTSGGFGSVYFTTGSPGSGDIKVADMTFEVEHKYDDSGSTTVSGSFCVTD